MLSSLAGVELLIGLIRSLANEEVGRDTDPRGVTLVHESIPPRRFTEAE